MSDHWGIWSITDVDRDGLPDFVRFGDPDNEWVEPGITYHPRGLARPGLMVAVESTFGARTEVAYVSSATVPPSGGGGTDTRVHEMAQHRDIVERVRVEDPVTGAWGRSDYVFDRGVCMPGKCLGYETLEVTRTALTPVECGAPGFPYPESRTTTLFDLARDFAQPATRTVELYEGGGDYHLDTLYQTTYENVYLGELAPEFPAIWVRWPHVRVRTDYGTLLPDDLRQSSVTLEYDEWGNVLTATHTGTTCPEPSAGWPVGTTACGGASQDVLSAYTWAYAPDGSNHVLVTMTTAHDNGSGFFPIEHGVFTYDGYNQPGQFDEGLLTKQVVAAGMPGTSLTSAALTWTFERSSRGAVIEKTAPAGYSEATLYTFGDALPSYRENSEGHVFQTTYDDYGRVEYEVDPNGVAKGRTYDPFGRIATTTLSGGGDEYVTSATNYVDTPYQGTVATLEYLYTDPAEPPDVRARYQVLDGFGDVVQAWDPAETTGKWYVHEVHRNIAGTEVATTYPHPVTSFQPGLHPATTSDDFASCQVLDGFGRPIESYEDRTADLGHRTYAYGAGWTLEELAGGYQKVTYEDTLGRLVEVHDGQNDVLVRTGSYAYDGRGRVTAFWDAEESAYYYDFDGAGRLRDVWRQAAFLPRDLWYSYGYDGPNPIWMEEWGTDGHTAVAWDYDTLGRPVLMSVYNEDQALTWDPDSSLPWQFYTWEWDTEWIGARSRVTDPDGEVLYTYDPGPFGALGHPSRIERTWNSRTFDPEDDRAAAYEYEYTLDGRALSTTWPGGTVVEAGYGPTGWLSEHVVSTPLWAPVSVRYDVDAFGLDAGFEADSGYALLSSVISRSSPSRIDQIAWSVDGTTTRSVAYDYAASGLLTGKDIGTPTTLPDEYAYTYDALQRVTWVKQKVDTGPGGWLMEPREHYVYDTLGNKEWLRRWDNPQSSYPSEQWSYYSFPFGQVGGRSEYPQEEEFAWDGAGRMVGWHSYGPETAHRSFAYDGKGRMVSAWDGPVLSVYGYDVDDQLVYEEFGTGYAPFFRFSGQNDYGRYPLQGTHRLEQLLPMLKTWDGYLYFTFQEPDGHTLEIYNQAGTAVELDVQGVYGRAMAQASDSTWPVGGLHGSESDWVWEHTHMGVRSMLDLDGTWMQPEPLLYLGPTNGNLREPLFYGPLYANGNTLALSDRGGEFAVPTALAAAAPFVESFVTAAAATPPGIMVAAVGTMAVGACAMSNDCSTGAMFVADQVSQAANAMFGGDSHSSNLQTSQMAGEGGDDAETSQGGEGVIDIDGASPPFTGEPGSTVRGKKQSRTYGDDGFPQTDRDLPHAGERGKGNTDTQGSKDHAHDWGRPEDGSNPTETDRGSSREPIDGDPPPPRGFGD